MNHRRRRSKHSSKTLTLSARDADDWAVVREKAKRRRLSMSRYAEALVLGNGWEARDGPALKLDGREQRKLLAHSSESDSISSMIPITMLSDHQSERSGARVCPSGGTDLARAQPNTSVAAAQDRLGGN